MPDVHRSHLMAQSKERFSFSRMLRHVDRIGQGCDKQSCWLAHVVRHAIEK